MARDGAPEPARVRHMRCVDAPLGGEVDAFYAFFVLEGRLASVHRRFNLDLPSLSHTPERYRSRIVLTTYAASGEGLEPEDERVLFAGEDPRVVSDGQRAFILSRVFDGAGQSGDPAEYRLGILPDGVVRDIAVPPALKGGKNWQPFLRDGRLFAVCGFAPLTLAEITGQGEMRVIHQGATEFWMPAPHDRYTMLRGGSNAVASGNAVIGLGHLTRSRDDHRPFFWTLDSSMQMTLSFPSSFFGLRGKGFNIVDPTSLFVFDGRLHIGLCCSEREWFYPQRFLDMLVALPASDARCLQDAGHAAMFAAPGDPGLDSLPTSHTLLPRDMPHQVPRRAVDGGVESRGEAGCLVHGPYHPVEEEGAFVATLNYVASGLPAGRPAGRFEVSCVRDGEVTALASQALAGTGGAAATASLPFSTAGRRGWQLETRVFVEKGERLNALSIRILDDYGESRR